MYGGPLTFLAALMPCGGPCRALGVQLYPWNASRARPCGGDRLRDRNSSPPIDAASLFPCPPSPATAASRALTDAGALPATYASAGAGGLAELLTVETDGTGADERAFLRRGSLRPSPISAPVRSCGSHGCPQRLRGAPEFRHHPGHGLWRPAGPRGAWRDADLRDLAVFQLRPWRHDGLRGHGDDPRDMGDAIGRDHAGAPAPPRSWRCPLGSR